MVPGSQPAPPRLMPRCLAVPQNNRVAEVPWVPSSVDGAGPALGAQRHGGTDPRNCQRARRVALACEVVSEDHITRSKTARGAIADPDFHLPRENTDRAPALTEVERERLMALGQDLARAWESPVATPETRKK